MVPFQCSNSSEIVSVAALLSQPAAHRSLGPVPEMAVSTSESPGMPVAGLGLGTIDHLVPFQCSIRVGPSPVVPAPPLKLVPTAQALPGLRSSTAFSRACCPAGCGTGTRVQVLPDRCSASGWSRAFWSMKVPAAHASPGPVADTLASVLLVGSGAMPCGLTVASTFQIEPAAAPPGRRLWTRPRRGEHRRWFWAAGSGECGLGDTGGDERGGSDRRRRDNAFRDHESSSCASAHRAVCV